MLVVTDKWFVNQFIKSNDLFKATFITEYTTHVYIVQGAHPKILVHNHNILDHQNLDDIGIHQISNERIIVKIYNKLVYYIGLINN